MERNLLSFIETKDGALFNRWITESNGRKECTVTNDDMLFRMRRALLAAAAKEGVTAACIRFGVSRTTFYKWKARYLAYGEDGLRPKERRPPVMPNQLSAQVEASIMAYISIWPTHGPARIANELARDKWGSWKVSASGVYNVLRRAGLSSRYERLVRLEEITLMRTGVVTERALKIRPRGGRGPIEAAFPGDLICLDTFYVGKLKGVGKVWQFTAVDASCSYAFARLAPANTAAEAAAFLICVLIPAYLKAGIRIKAILTDNGSEYKGAFAKAVAQARISHRKTRPKSPQTNGFVERFHGTVLHEFYRITFRRKFYRGRASLNKDLQSFLRYYNFDRTHQGYRLKGKTPASVFFSAKERAAL